MLNSFFFCTIQKTNCTSVCALKQKRKMEKDIIGRLFFFFFFDRHYREQI